MSNTPDQEIAALKARVAELEHAKTQLSTGNKVLFEQNVNIAAKRDKLAAQLKEWQDYWGCDDPHDSHIQSGSGPTDYALGKEQERANRLAAQVEKLRAFAQDVDKIRGASADQILTIELRHGLRIESEDQNCRKTPLLTGEPE